MPKAAPHFDALALLRAVDQQPVGLKVTTNNPVRFREIMYKNMRAAEHLRCRIYANPRSRVSFFLVKRDRLLPGATEVQETPDGGEE